MTDSPSIAATLRVQYLGGLGPSPLIALRDPTRALRFDLEAKAVREMPAADALDLCRRDEFALVVSEEDAMSRYGVTAEQLGELPLERNESAVVLTAPSAQILREASTDRAARSKTTQRSKRSKGGAR